MGSTEIKIKLPADVPLLTGVGDHRSEEVFHTLEQTLFDVVYIQLMPTYSQRTAEYNWPVYCYHHTRMHLLLVQSTYFFASLICGMAKTGLRLWCNLELRSSPSESSGHYCSVPCPNHITYPAIYQEGRGKDSSAKRFPAAIFLEMVPKCYFPKLRSAVGSKICNTAVIQSQYHGLLHFNHKVAVHISGMKAWINRLQTG